MKAKEVWGCRAKVGADREVSGTAVCHSAP